MRYGIRKFTAVFLAAIMLFGIMPAVDFTGSGEPTSTVNAVENWTTGYCGADEDEKNLSYSLDNNGVLTISGTGKMGDYLREVNIYQKRSPFYSDNRITSVVIEEGVTNIGAYAFHNCQNLTEVSLPESLTEIKQGAFMNDVSLNTVGFPESLKKIMNAAFKGCSALEDVEFPEGLSEIGSGAFRECSSLNEIDLPENLSVLGSGAFAWTHLTSFSIPQGITTIERETFAGTYISDIVIPDHIVTVADDAFSSMQVPVNSITYGQNLKNFGCISSDRTDNTITDFTPPDTLETFGGVFLKSLRTVNLNGTIEYTGYSSGMFLYTLDLSINIDASNPYMRSYDNVIYNDDCSQILWMYKNRTGRISFPKEMTTPLILNENGKTYNFNYYDVEEGSETFKSVDGILYSKDMTKLYACPMKYSSKIIVPDTVKTIGRCAFAHLSVEIELNDSIEVIEYGAFEGTNGSNYDLVLPKNLQSLGDYSFNGCNYRSVTMPDTPITINVNTFVSSYIKKVVLGKETSLNFNNVSTTFGPFGRNLESIEVSNDNPNYASYSGAVFNKNLTRLLYVPPKLTSMELPKETSSLNYLPSTTADITVDSENPYFRVEDNIFLLNKRGTMLYRTKDIRTNVVVPDGVEGLYRIRSESEFKPLNISKATTLTLPEGFKYIDSDDINSGNLVTINIPSTVKSIGFNGASKLQNINLSEGFEQLTGLHGCSRLRNLNLPKSCKYARITSEHFPNPTTLTNLVVNNPNCKILDWEYLTDSVNVSAYCGSPAHQAALKRNSKFVSLGHSYLDWYTATPATYDSDGVERRDCAYCNHYEERAIPKLVRTTFTATFMADGKVVSKVDFTSAMSKIEEPPVPEKDRYLGEWEPYELGDEDITINAKYTLIKAEDARDIDTDSSVDYYYDTDDVQFNIKASSKAKTVKSTISQSIPLDIVLVVDQSGSMYETLGSNKKKIDALKEAAAAFVAKVKANADLTNTNHRIAMAGFGLADTYPGFERNENTELLTNPQGVPIVYHNIKNSDYAGALLDVRTKQTELQNAIDSIQANGATAANLGLEMAKNIYANSNSDGRERVVVFMTDGKPTKKSEFENEVANGAINNANILKNTYNASVYSIGVFESATTDVNTFMNAVSSDYPNATSMKKLGHKQSEAYCTMVNNTDALSNVFTTITTESLSHTAAFDKLTLIKTLSKYVTLTSRQEQELRASLIRQYGITDNDIKINRKGNGTTEIKILNLTPYEVDNGNGDFTYEASVSFFASLNQNASQAGEYEVDTEDSGVMLGDTIGYEATFNTSKINLESDKDRVVYKINNDVYDICEGESAPETDFPSDWNFSGWSGSGSERNATLTKPKRTITWHTADNDIVQEYEEGWFITPPEAVDKSETEKFLSWNKSIPTTMPDNDLEFTAVYGGHVHKYVSRIVTPVTCLADGKTVYTCDCGDSYEETVPALGHNFEAITSSKDEAANDEDKCTFVCSYCGERYNYSLNYQLMSKFGWGRSLYEFKLSDEDLSSGDIQPDGTINIRIPLTNAQLNQAKYAYVTRTQDGNQVIVPFEIKDGCLVIKADHFTPYNIIFADENTYITSDDEEINKTATFSRDAEDNVDFSINREFMNLQILGVQKKAVVSDKHAVRFVAVIKDKILQDAEQYGFIAVASDTKDKARENITNLTLDSANSKNIFYCKGSDNNVSGKYGMHNSDTDYKYVTFAVNDIGDTYGVAVKFFVKDKSGNVHYSDYINKNGDNFNNCAVDWISLNNQSGATGG